MLYIFKLIIFILPILFYFSNAIALDSTFYIGSINSYKVNDSSFNMYPLNKSPGIHNSSSNPNNPFGCEMSQTTLPGANSLFFDQKRFYSVYLNVSYTDGTVATNQQAIISGSFSSYAATSSGAVNSCTPTINTGCQFTLSGSGSMGSAGWEGNAYLVVPKIPGKIVKGVAKNNTLINTCYMRINYQGGRVFASSTWLTYFVDSNGSFNYNPNTPTCTVTAPTLTIPNGTTAKAVSVAIGATFGASANQNLAISCSAKSTGGMTLTVGTVSTADSIVNSSNSNGIMVNTGTATGTSAKLSFTGSSGSDCSIAAGPVPFGVAQNLCNGQNVTVGVQGQLSRTAALVGPGSINNSLVINLQYN